MIRERATAQVAKLSNETIRAMLVDLLSSSDWRPKTEPAPTYMACLLRLDVKDNPGAGIDETYAIAWHDGTRWHDVNARSGEGNPGPWVVAWMAIPGDQDFDGDGGAP